MSDGLKYTTHEEAEKGYRELQQLTSAKEEELKTLQGQMRAPESYVIPSNMQIDGDVREKLNNLGKDISLTQDQYNKFANKLLQESVIEQERVKAQQQELTKITDYEDRRSKLDTYLDQKYSQPVSKLLKEKMALPEFFNNLWDEREKSVQSSGLPTGTTASIPFNNEDLLKLRSEWHNNPHKLYLKDKYLAMLERKGNLRKVGQLVED